MTAAASLPPRSPALNTVLDTLGDVLGHAVLIVDACDPRRPILHANRRFTELTGHELGGVPDPRVAQFITQPADPKLNREFHKALKAGRSFMADWPIRHKSGATFPGRIRLRHLQDKALREDASGRGDVVSPGHLLVTLEDLSGDQRDAKEVEQRWERAKRATTDGLYDWDLHSGHVWYAQRFRAILGYDAQEFPDTFLAFQHALHEDDRTLVLSKIRAHLESCSRLDIRCRVVTRQGKIRWCRLRGEAERDAGGRPTRLSGALSDISEQIDAQEALHRSQEFYGTILDSLPLMIVYVCREGRVVYANRLAQEVSGRSLGNVRGRTLGEVLGPRAHARLNPYISDALDGRPVESQQRFRNAQGDLIDLEAAFIPHRDDAREILGCFITGRDLTERRQLEAELRQSQKMEAVGRLTGGIAHDFNNLLSVIIGNMQLLARSLRESPRLLRQADTALGAAMRGANLTRRLLAFARQQVLEPRVVDLNVLIGGMCELLRRTLAGELEIECDLAAQPWVTRVDPGQMENAVLNLVINARDALPAGGAISIATRNRSVGGAHTAQEGLAAQVEADLEPVPPEIVPGDYVILEVRDGGTGMSEETLKRVFEPFFTTKDVGKGSGLGLSMVYGFVKQSGGHIQIRSQLGQGTSARLYLPRAHHHAPCDEAQKGEESDLPRGTETILVVEDNVAVRATAVDILSSLGYRVREATNAHEALAWFERDTSIALVFSDIMLPGGLLGPQLVEEILARRADVQVLLTSGFSETSVMSRGILDGAIDLLAKPYTLEELAWRVREKLDSKEEA